MNKKKSVKEVVKDVFDRYFCGEFNLYDSFIVGVKYELRKEGKGASEGSILRRMRELKEEGEINYSVLNRTKGTYRKLVIEEEQSIRKGKIIRQARLEV